MITPRVVVYAPAYTRQSAGIHALHWLADQLIQRGVDCRTLIFGPTWNAPPEAFCQSLSHRPVTDPDALVGAVAVYPEIVADDPLAPHGIVGRVRWLLNFDGALTGQRIDRTDSLVVTWSRAFDPDAPRLIYPFYDTDLFNLDDAPPWEERKLVLAYSGKADHCIIPASVAGNVVHITRIWPGDRKHLAEILKNGKWIFSADPISALNDEALLCGCGPVITHWGRWDADALLHTETPDVVMFNKAGDFEQAAIRAARRTLIDRIGRLREGWDAALDGLISSIEAMTLVTVGA